MYCPTYAVSVVQFAFPVDFVLAGYRSRSGWLLLQNVCLCAQRF